jgi:hypothetical protein
MYGYSARKRSVSPSAPTQSSSHTSKAKAMAAPKPPVRGPNDPLYYEEDFSHEIKAYMTEMDVSSPTLPLCLVSPWHHTLLNTTDSLRNRP